MKHRKHGQRRERATGGFETHRRRGAVESGDVRNGRPWRFMDKGLPGLPEPHYRVTARMLALPGKHIRGGEPLRAAHGKEM